MNIVLNVLNEFHLNSVQYCIFKEYDLLEKTLQGDEDIDVLIRPSDYKRAKEILICNGYHLCYWPKPLDGICFWIGYDKETGVRTLLHIHTKLRIGTKREKELHWSNLEKRILNTHLVDETGFVHTICPEDEICLLFIRMILRKKPNDDDYARLEELRARFDINDVALGKEIIKMIGKKDSENISLQKYIDSDEFGTEQERKFIRKYLWDKKKCSTILRLIWGKIHYGFLFIRKKLRFPLQPIKKIGHIYAVIGVDGSGKSTLIDNMLLDPYLQSIGIKKIYGGSNEYWIPGLQQAVVTGKGNRFVKKVRSILCFLDRRLRVVGAFFITLTGRNVIFDRYYYDEYVGYVIAKKANPKSKKNLVKKVMNGWIGIKPYKTFFLDIKPEVAYSRKQDYSYERLQTNIETYQMVMKDRKEVVVIDAEIPPEDIKRYVISIIANS